VCLSRVPFLKEEAQFLLVTAALNWFRVSVSVHTWLDPDSAVHIVMCGSAFCSPP
jgi:hypothetical protein